MTACSVIALLAATPASGATGAPTSSADSRARESAASPRVAPVQCPPGSKPVAAGCIDKHPVHIEYCLTARRGAAFYRARTWRMQRERGAELAGRTPIVRGKSCHWARYAARVWHARAKAAAKALERWQEEWAWERWLPAKFYRVARCETGVRWDWDSGTYVSAFGIIRVAYEWYHPWTGHNSPREQYEVAAAIQRRFGWSAWGCGGA